MSFPNTLRTTCEAVAIVEVSNPKGSVQHSAFRAEIGPESSQALAPITGILFALRGVIRQNQVAHIRQYALPVGGLRGWAINDLRSAHNAAVGSSTTHLAASGNRHSALPFCRPSVRALGAKLGAIRCGLLRTAMDHYGQRTVWFRTVWTAVDFYGRSASIYGSEGWGFEFLRACQQSLYGSGLVA